MAVAGAKEKDEMEELEEPRFCGSFSIELL